jgi:hypothetical protein
MFHLTHDYLGRTIALGPADAVSLLAVASRQGWTEIPDVAYGYSQDYAPGTRAHDYALALHRLAGGTRIDYIYAESAWDPDAHRPVEGFLRARELDLVVCRTFSFGYVADPETAPVHFSG